MKNFIKITSMSLLMLGSHLYAKENPLINKWIDLSASSQNLHEGMRSVGDANPDLSVHQVALKNVDDALSELVKSGFLVSKHINLKFQNKEDQEALTKLSNRIGDLQNKYGYYTAIEMCDLGARHRFKTLQPADKLEINIRLPQKDLDTFLNTIKKLNLQAEN